MITVIKDGNICTTPGMKASATYADIKGNGKERLDLSLLYSDVPCLVSGVFTTSSVVAAPVIFDKDLLARCDSFHGILVNSGNANACTSSLGLKNCSKVMKAYEKHLKLPNNSLLMASTGVIGEQLPVDRIISAADSICSNLGHENGKDFAKAIMTTDKFEKEIAISVETSHGTYYIGATAKGAGMIDPNMATMLAFITTDAVISKEQMDISLKLAVDSSFNCITVDGDMSTNDSVFLISNSSSDVEILTENDIKTFNNALKHVCANLAKLIVKDGEGATKHVTISVKGAASSADAKDVAEKIANSPLIKTMFAGADPNWGRIMAAIGASSAKIDQEMISIHFDNLKYVENGRLFDPNLEEKACEIMKRDEYVLSVSLNMGKEGYTAYTCDFTNEYIDINTDYRS